MLNDFHFGLVVSNHSHISNFQSLNSQQFSPSPCALLARFFFSLISPPLPLLPLRPFTPPGSRDVQCELLSRGWQMEPAKMQLQCIMVNNTGTLCVTAPETVQGWYKHLFFFFFSPAAENFTAD